MATTQNAGDSAAKRSDPQASDPKAPDPTVAYQSSDGKKYVLFEGTILEAVLINRLDGSFSGPLIACSPQTFIRTTASTCSFQRAARSLVRPRRWTPSDRCGLPSLSIGSSCLTDSPSDLDQFKGLDQAGATALKDKVNNHYVKIFGASLALGVLGGVAQIGTGSALTSTGTERIQQGFGVGMASAGEEVLDRFLNILPTVTIREGTRVKVYLSNDLLLPEYSAHNMPSNL